MRERLLTLKEEQQENRRLCGRSYIKDYLEYVCVNEIGDLIKPHYVTESFPKLLKAKGMRQISKKKSPVIWAQSLDMTGFFAGGGRGIRTHGRFLAVKRFRVVLVMTSSIALRISQLFSVR